MLIALALAYFLLPDSALGCSQHDLHDHLKNTAQIFVNMLSVLLVATPVGLFTGRFLRQKSSTFKKLTIAWLAAGIFSADPRTAVACHGIKTVEPILQKIYAAQMEYRKQHGTYARSFDELGFLPASADHSFFLPTQTVLAKNTAPKPGLDLTQLPDGVTTTASAEGFTVVAIAFAEPNRIDIWTMDQKKNYNERSVPAIRNVELKPPAGQPVSFTDRISEFLNDWEMPLMTTSVLFGLILGLMLSLRKSQSFKPAEL